MVKFILSKFFYGILVLIGVVFIIFALFNILPVDPARLTLGQRADVESFQVSERGVTCTEIINSQRESGCTKRIKNF